MLQFWSFCLKSQLNACFADDTHAIISYKVCMICWYWFSARELNPYRNIVEIFIFINRKTILVLFEFITGSLVWNATAERKKSNCYDWGQCHVFIYEWNKPTEECDHFNHYFNIPFIRNYNLSQNIVWIISLSSGWPSLHLRASVLTRCLRLSESATSFETTD